MIDQSSIDAMLKDALSSLDHSASRLRDAGYRASASADPFTYGTRQAELELAVPTSILCLSITLQPTATGLEIWSSIQDGDGETLTTVGGVRRFSHEEPAAEYTKSLASKGAEAMLEAAAASQRQYDGGWNMPDDYMGHWESYTTPRKLIRKIVRGSGEVMG
jgi:hypothetical protein